jgi:hypothetical protein
VIDEDNDFFSEESNSHPVRRCVESGRFPRCLSWKAIVRDRFYIDIDQRVDSFVVITHQKTFDEETQK